jgi:serine/threonine protein kinase
MARIYIARSSGIGSFERHVVLKMILPEKAHDDTAVKMFLDEARLAASLNHQNVAQVFEVGEDGGIHYLAMEYVHGQDLRALLAKAGSEGTRVPLELALTVVTGAAAGLNHAHERRTSDGTPMGIVHRDVSPSNIMIGYDGAVKLLDFGIAKAAERSVETQSGIIKGKFAYMAPEQCRGRDVDRRSDVFSLGIILYEVTTQHRCFRADSDFDTMHRIVTGDVVRPTRLVQGYPQALEAIVMKALAVDVQQRYQSAGDLLEAIESFAVAARMSLSMMSLGRFMRDMFGDIQEPWLVPGRIPQAPPPKEHTISNTNGTGARAPARASPPPPPPPHEEAPLHLPPSGPLALPVAGERSSQAQLPLERPSYVADAPRSEPAAAGWNASGYPLLPPGYAAAAMMAPDGRRSSANLPPMVPPMSVPMPMGLAVGAQQTPSPQFGAQLGSSSGPAHNALPVGAPLTHQGYPGAPGLGQSEGSYPHYEPPPQVDEEVSLQPSNRLLYVGLGVVLVGVIVLLAIWLAGDRPEDQPPARPSPSPTIPGAVPGSDEPRPAPENPGGFQPDPVKPEAFQPDAAAPANDLDAGAPVSDESIRIHVTSVPPGADVLLAGKVIGTTPLDTKLQRSTGLATLTVHHARFVDQTATVDLSGDYQRELTLVPVPDDPAPKPPVRDHDPRPTGGRDRPLIHDTSSKPHVPPPPPPPVKKCQAPDKFNPFDTSCGGEPCPPCK